MDYSHILWDFNGTILNDVEIGIEAINVLLAEEGLPLLESAEAYREKFRFPIEEYYRSVGLDFSKAPYSEYAHRWIGEYRAREKEAPLCPGAKEALEYVKALQIPQILFSATEKEMLLRQVAELEIGDCFDEILGAENIYAVGKIALGRQWAERIRPANGVLIGDTEHDALAAAEMGVDCILIANGHRTAEQLRATGCPVYPDLFALLKDWRKKSDA